MKEDGFKKLLSIINILLLCVFMGDGRKKFQMLSIYIFILYLYIYAELGLYEDYMWTL